jgi:long-chain acyl-CoA synthetase
MVEQVGSGAFYNSRPWRNEYGPGIPKDFSPLPYKSLGELIRRASVEYAGKPAYSICLDNGLNATLKFHEVDVLSDRFMAYLRHEARLSPGDRVAIQMPNCLAYPVATFGVFKSGAVLVNINPLYTAKEMQFQLKDSGAKLLVIIDLFADKLDEALRGTAVEKVLLVSIADFFPAPQRLLIKTVLKLKGQLPRSAASAERFTSAIEAGARHLRDPSGNGMVERSADDLAVLQYTGGTTGVAKGAELTHGNLLANVAQVEAIAGAAVRRGEDTVMTALPLYHIFAFTFNLMCFYMFGCRNVLCPSPRPPKNLRKAFEKFQINKFSGVNLLFHALSHEDWFRSNPPRALDLSIAGGTALHTSTAEEWRRITGNQIVEGYGLTETSPVLVVNPPKGEIRTGTIGIPLVGTDVRIVDDAGNPVPPGEIGELIARGPQVLRGYWNRPDETKNALRDGWFYTGDMATMDARGYIRIVDRKKDMIDVSGFNVYPNEVEDCIDRHPDVAEVAVVGVPLPEGGERVRAYVVSVNPELTAEALIEHCRQHLTNYKVPKEIIFRQELPKTPVGKILRRDLRQEARQEAAG